MAYAGYTREVVNETPCNNHLLMNFSEHATILRSSASNKQSNPHYEGGGHNAREITTPTKQKRGAQYYYAHLIFTTNMSHVN